MLIGAAFGAPGQQGRRRAYAPVLYTRRIFSFVVRSSLSRAVQKTLF